MLRIDYARGRYNLLTCKVPVKVSNSYVSILFLFDSEYQAEDFIEFVTLCNDDELFILKREFNGQFVNHRK